VSYDGWNKVKVAENCFITVHPDLPATVVEHKGCKAILIGYAIDPYQLDLNEESIARRFVDTSVSAADVIAGIEKISGRFVFIVKTPNNFWLFHDAVALRQVNYCKDKTGAVWCASQADALAEQLGLEYDEEVLSYRKWAAQKANIDEFWLMNDRTPYHEIKNLLPNHYLDLREAKAVRYWPARGCIPSLSVDESIELCTPILQNSIKAAAMRFDLQVGISAGGDSRKTLAACRGVRDRVSFFTHTPTQSSMVFNDVKVPARLLPRLGLAHQNLGMKQMSEEFRTFYERSATWSREKRGHIAYTLLDKFGPDSTVVNSNISEVAQCIYWLPKSKINGKGLATLSVLNHPLCIGEFQKWLDGAKGNCAAAQMNIMDLFFLEQRMGRWATAAFSEYDIAHETFNPYNNRHLHCLMLAISDRHRKNRRWDVTIKHIKYMWPEVLLEPINPPDRTADKIQQFIRRIIVHQVVTPWFPIYEYLRYRKLEKRFKKQLQ
jgi:hypothetical protein